MNIDLFYRNRYTNLRLRLRIGRLSTFFSAFLAENFYKFYFALIFIPDFYYKLYYPINSVTK